MTKAHRPIPRFFQRSALWAALSLSIFGSAQALTLNRPVVQSKQGEALRVEIDINEISATELTDFQASLANTETYIATRAEVPLSNGSPMEIQVQLLRRDNGRLYLKVTSKQPVSGNTMDLLLDLRWATGRMLRDISLSLDESKAAAKPIRAPAVLGSGSQKKNGQQLEVQRGDTAGQLASENMPAGVSLDQMLLALLRNNPDAFVDDNVNRLKAGALLTMPTEQEARAFSRDDARKQIQIQTKDFEAYRSELAARAPGGAIPKATRNSVGRLEARIENKNAKTNQDKLTLSKPSKNGAEEKIAKQREAQEAAKRAEELSRNIEDLAKIAAATAVRASEPTSGQLAVAPPAPSAQASADAWLDELTHNPLAPVGAGSLIALLVLIGLWRRHANRKRQEEQDIQGLPPLNVKFDLNLPTFEEPTVEKHLHPDHLHGHLNDHSQSDDHANHDVGHSPATASMRPTMDMPNVSLDLNQASNSPYQVRIDLADELWNLGQLHTSRALMEEVAHEASGADKEKALSWLAERG